jgi:hypothetical protein
MCGFVSPTPATRARSEKVRNPYIRASRRTAGLSDPKVKCDGKLPCSYCSRHKRAHLCHFTPQRRRRLTLHSPTSPASVHSPAQSSEQPSARPETPRDTSSAASAPTVLAALTTTPTAARIIGALPSDASAEDEAEVPRDARLLYDAQGKLGTIHLAPHLSACLTRLLYQYSSATALPCLFSRR